MVSFRSVSTWTTSSKVPYLFALSTCATKPGVRNDYAKKRNVGTEFAAGTKNRAGLRSSVCTLTKVAVMSEVLSTVTLQVPKSQEEAAQLTRDTGQRGQRGRRWGCRDGRKPWRVHLDDQLLELVHYLVASRPTGHHCSRPLVFLLAQEEEGGEAKGILLLCSPNPSVLVVVMVVAPLPPLPPPPLLLLYSEG